MRFIATASRSPSVLHGLVSTLVGLLYGAMLPMFPRRPILLGGLIAPVLWSGLLYSILGLAESAARRAASTGSGSWRRRWPSALSPASSSCGSRAMPTRENVSFALRAGIEAPGTDATARRWRGRAVSTRLMRSGDSRRSALALLASAAARPPGQPRKGSETLAPNEVVEFGALYAENCAGCHGAEDEEAPRSRSPIRCISRIVDDASMRDVIAERRARNVDAGVRAKRRRHADGRADRCDRAAGSDRAGAGRELSTARIRLPTRRSPRATRTRRSRVSDATAHPATARRSRADAKGSAITNDSFLALVSDQGLRTIVIAGRPELGAPDWRGNVPGQPMSDQEVTDVVAWLASHRVPSPGQPYSRRDASSSARSRDDVERNDC